MRQDFIKGQAHQVVRVVVGVVQIQLPDHLEDQQHKQHKPH